VSWVSISTDNNLLIKYHISQNDEFYIQSCQQLVSFPLLPLAKTKLGQQLNTWRCSKKPHRMKTGTYQTQNYRFLRIIHIRGPTTPWLWSTCGRKSTANPKTGAESTRLFMLWSTSLKMARHESSRILKTSNTRSDRSRTSTLTKMELTRAKELETNQGQFANYFLTRPGLVKNANSRSRPATNFMDILILMLTLWCKSQQDPLAANMAVSAAKILRNTGIQQDNLINHTIHLWRIKVFLQDLRVLQHNQNYLKKRNRRKRRKRARSRNLHQKIAIQTQILHQKRRKKRKKRKLQRKKEKDYRNLIKLAELLQKTKHNNNNQAEICLILCLNLPHLPSNSKLSLLLKLIATLLSLEVNSQLNSLLLNLVRIFLEAWVLTLVSNISLKYKTHLDCQEWGNKCLTNQLSSKTNTNPTPSQEWILEMLLNKHSINHLTFSTKALNQ